jgi:hypothetical protein
MSNPIVPPLVAFAAFGAQEVPILQNITALLGTTANCLQAVATDKVQGPYTVALMLPGLPIQFWTARGGTDATDVSNGIVQAGDFAATGVVWYQSQP